MKKHKQPVCPGCSRHCTADEIRCKRGRAYFAKLSENAMKADSGRQTGAQRKYKYKWERNVAQGGVMWHLLCISRRIKKALRRGEVTETQLLDALSESEKAQLLDILHKMSRKLD